MLQPAAQTAVDSTAARKTKRPILALLVPFFIRNSDSRRTIAGPGPETEPGPSELLIDGGHIASTVLRDGCNASSGNRLVDTSGIARTVLQDGGVVAIPNHGRFVGMDGLEDGCG